MHLSSLLTTASLLLFSSTSLSSPLFPRQTSEYYLKTRTLDATSNKNGLFVLAYHTGAGLNDVVLTSNTTEASKGFLQDTFQLFDFGTSFPWSFSMGGSANYAAWEPVTINTGSGTSGYRIEGENTLEWGEKGSGFGGWMACDWFHGEPQLFWRYAYYAYPIPCACADVILDVVSL